MPRYFTPDEANAALAEVRPIAERLVAHRRAQLEAAARRARVATQIGGNGGGLEAREVERIQAELAAAAEVVASCVEQLDQLGVQVKDLARGLVDFPGLRGDREVLLCWQVGEDRVAHWHGVDEGFAGRKPL